VNPQPLNTSFITRWFPAGRTIAIWLPAVISPAGYFILVALADKAQLPSPPEALAAALFYLIPPVALVTCLSAVWMSRMTAAARISWTLLTLLAIGFQVLVILAILVTAAIG